MKKLVFVSVLLVTLSIASNAVIMPDAWDGEKWWFQNQFCDPWDPNPEEAKDPVLDNVIGFQFDMVTEGYDFLAIAFPDETQWDNIPITIVVNDEDVATVYTVDPDNSSDWYIFSPTVSSFQVYWDIPISIDTEDMVNFAWWLRFEDCPSSTSEGVTYTVTPIPEPATLMLLSVGGLMLRKLRQ